jgi:transcriptional regulator with PAS, ATPase and Fis domain
MTVRDITERKRREIVMEQEKKCLQKEITTLKTTIKDRYRFGDIIGKSAVMQVVYEQILKAVATDANVFIDGESGTGKELIARTIHKVSKRREQRFVPVNCGAIPESLFESEFFGHRKGSFTGAFRDKQGFFGAAHKGTLFLDELGELTPSMQVKLLRVLDDREYMPVGDTVVKKVDVRIIAATNRNLEDLRKRGLIREDFFFRIHVFTITAPPLRERKEDIPLLVDHFLSRYSSGEPLPTIPGEIMEILYNYDWPGNVREFQNALQRYLSGQPLNFLDSYKVEFVKKEVLSQADSTQGIREFREVT